MSNYTCCRRHGWGTLIILSRVLAVYTACLQSLAAQLPGVTLISHRNKLLFLFLCSYIAALGPSQQFCTAVWTHNHWKHSGTASSQMHLSIEHYSVLCLSAILNRRTNLRIFGSLVILRSRYRTPYRPFGIFLATD